MLMVLAVGCAKSKSSAKSGSPAKLISQKDLTLLPGPDSIQLFKEGQIKDIKPGQPVYKDSLAYFETQLSQCKLKLADVKLDTLMSEELSKQTSMAFHYTAAKKISVNFEKEGKKDVNVQLIAFVLSGKYKGYLFIGEGNGKSSFYEKIVISDNFYKNLK